MDTGRKPEIQRAYEYFESLRFRRWYLCHRSADGRFVFASLSLVVLSAVLTGLNVYDNIAKHAGAGTLVPITGFANSMVSAAMEFKTEGYILGLGAKMFSIAGPVIVYGVSASVIYGIILVLFG